MKRKEGAFIVAQAAIVIAVLAALALPLSSLPVPQSSSSSTTQAGGPLAFVSPVSPQGLQLEVTLNSSSIQSHGAISARVEALNTLDQNVSLSGLAQNQNISDWSNDDYVCDSPSTIVGFALFRGHFAAGNISAAGQPLQLAPPEVIYCAFAIQPGAVTFLPKGDRAIAKDYDLYSGAVTVSVNATTGDCGDNPELVGLCTGTALSGYWNDSIPAPGALNFTSPAFAYFPPGVYTIAATDLWDQYVYATFVVEPSPQTTTFSSGASPDGLQLELKLNATTVRSDGAVSAQIEVVNTLNHNVSISMPGYNQNITGLGQTMKSLNEFDYTCGQNPSGFLADFALFQGHITAANLSLAGTPLRLDALFEPPCPGFYVGQEQAIFLPKSNQVIVTDNAASLTAAVNATTLFCTGSGLGGGGGEIDCGNTTGLVGYWNASILIENGQLGLDSPALVHFPPGEYTIVACDAFNQYLYATFVVL